MVSAAPLPTWRPGLKHHCVIKWNYALNHRPLSCSCTHSLPAFISLLPHQLFIFSSLFEAIIGSWDSFMTFILLGSSLPPLPSLSFLPSSLSLSVNYPCSLICRHPSNLRFPVMNQVPPPPPLPPPPPISAKQLTNQLILITRHRKTCRTPPFS